MTNDTTIIFPAEWAPQSGVMLTWPHQNTDWRDILDEVIPCYVAIAKEIIKREKLLIVCKNIEDVKKALGNIDYNQVIFREMDTNDTWARDHGPISVIANGYPFICDFTFNGWGMKFAANHDNQITKKLFASHAFAPEIHYQNMMHCVLEGGSLESDGCGTILTTSECLLSENRNEYKDKSEIGEYLKMIFGVKRILWLDHGYLAGDDTDSHIDTLARFCDPETIAYVKCEDKNDEHFDALSLMEKQLVSFKTIEGKPYRLIPLPMADAVYDNGERLPATYANFLIINKAVLFPTYNSPKDEIAKQQLQQAFPDREIIGINCLPLIKQHGSLHCITMQFPKDFIFKHIDT
ncbi:MAG: agmatine deiminase family protein [Dysgonamonadaceae bacterium]|jgi:agmatine/peptidylarginine deiminase|nr:agmatine deiminase family protein [Dysgonamonadaceae bacterium]